MSSCQAELSERTFYVKAVDKNGTTLVNKKTTTLRNGFFELWLPRERRIKLTIQGLGRKAQDMIYTFDQSKTCITNFRLQ